MSAELKAFLLAVAAAAVGQLIAEYLLNNIGSVRRAVR